MRYVLTGAVATARACQPPDKGVPNGRQARAAARTLLTALVKSVGAPLPFGSTRTCEEVQFRSAQLDHQLDHLGHGSPSYGGASSSYAHCAPSSPPCASPCLSRSGSLGGSNTSLHQLWGSSCSLASMASADSVEEALCVVCMEMPKNAVRNASRTLIG